MRGEAALSLLDVSDVSKVHSLASTLGSVVRLVYRRMSVWDVMGIVASLMENGDSLAREVSELLFGMRKLSCALRTTIIPRISTNPSSNSRNSWIRCWRSIRN